MKLTFDQIKSVTVGALSVKSTDKGIEFDRFTPLQVAAWYALEHVLGERAEATTGVRLDFYTDAKELRLSFTSGNKIEVLVDGLFREQFLMEEKRKEGERAVFAITDLLGKPLERARVTVVLSSHDRAVLDALELVDATYIEPVKHEKKILFIGDSITQGWASQYDSLSYAWRLTNFFDADSIIQGVGGGFYHRSFLDDIDFDPEIVFLAYGTNDFGHYPTKDAMRAEVRAFHDGIAERYGDKKVFVISPIWRGRQEKPMGSFAECREIVIDEARRHGFVHVDGLSLVPAGPSFFFDRDLHPDDLGFAFYAERLLKEILPQL